MVESTKLVDHPGYYRQLSNLAPYAAWALVAAAALGLAYAALDGGTLELGPLMWALGVLVVLYVVLDVI